MMPKTIDHQFWIEHELGKVKDEKRQAILRRRCSADDGVEWFYGIMRSRKGAKEFKDGTWPAKLPKLTPKYLQSRKRPCIGHGALLNCPIKPWPELYDDFIPICPSCQKIITVKQQEKSTLTNMTMPDEANPLTIIQTHRGEIQKERDKLKAHFFKQLSDTRITFNVLTSPEVGVTVSELLNDPEVSVFLKTFRPPDKVKRHYTKRKASKRKAATKTKSEETVKDAILELLKGGKELTRPQMSAAIKEQTGKKPYNIYKYTAQLLNEGKLVQPKENTFKLK